MNRSSVETWYGQNLFRSRLEARWAVFMDTAGIRWAYEPSWITVDMSETGGPVYNWRPDFQLEDGRWVEVKGQLSPAEHERLLLMAQAVSDGDAGGDVIVLGHLPEDDWHWPVQL